MATLALNAANRSVTLFGTLIDALNTAIVMTKAVRHGNPSAADISKVRAIAATI